MYHSMAEMPSQLPHQTLIYYCYNLEVRFGMDLSYRPHPKLIQFQ